MVTQIEKGNVRNQEGIIGENRGRVEIGCGGIHDDAGGNQYVMTATMMMRWRWRRRKGNVPCCAAVVKEVIHYDDE